MSTYIVWKLSTPTENLKDQQHNPVGLWHFYPFLVGYEAYLLTDVAFVGSILAGHWTAVHEVNENEFRDGKITSGVQIKNW